MEELRAIFPDTDPEVCEAILAANGGDVERAINALLEMNNPSAAPPTSETVAPPLVYTDDRVAADAALAASLAQEQEDEAFARQLEAQEREESLRAAEEAEANSEPNPTLQKVVSNAQAFGENAKKKVLQFFDKTFPKSGEGTTGGSSGGVGGTGGGGLRGGLGGLGLGSGSGGMGGGRAPGPKDGQRYSALPDEDFDALLGDEDEPLERRGQPNPGATSPGLPKPTSP
ncbi:hypothetical protein HK104_003937 [Borealophlyctis nickersoniae]|nr:hypothetical protein HK104_003937 [Borealophlyctis nickersoniae]